MINSQLPTSNSPTGRGTIRWAGVAVALCLAVSPAIAHHSFAAEFDDTKPVKLTGKVVEMRWSNPHAWIYLDVTNKGKTERWAFEMSGANGLFRRGWRKDDLPAGTVLVI